MRYRIHLPLLTILTHLVIMMTGCMEWDNGPDNDGPFEVRGSGLFIINEGNFQYGNATLSYYDPTDRKVENEIFIRANDMRLGDVAQSMTISDDGRGWIVVNHSHAVFAINTETFKECGRITGLPSPRYIHFINAHKAYVTQLWDNHIYIIDPTSYAITGTITVPDMEPENSSTEQMVQFGKYVFCTCWSYQNRVIKIDTETDQVINSLTVGIQPQSIALDANGKLWVLTDGGYEGSPYGYEAPTLCRIDPETMTVEMRFRFKMGSSPRSLQTNRARDTLYWLDDDVWRMSINETRPPLKPIIMSRDTKYYGLTIDPVNSEIYVADAIDYQQQGIIYRYTASGTFMESFYVGISPGAFCWKK
ncbi:MAG: YncE family protein [Bacteroidales bacterium]|nr:YncE family protein [Bacteroidales bacterium]